MSQAQTSPAKPTSLGAQAAAAAAAPAATPAANAPKPDDKPAAAAATSTTDTTEATAEAPKRSAKKVFVVVGEIHEFDSALKAEKFLNSDGAPTKYTVVKGTSVKTNNKVSLR